MKHPYIIKKYWSALIGDEMQYAMEVRIFNAVCIIATIGASLNAIINFVIGLNFYGLIILPLIVVLLFGYYLSRFRGRLDIAVGIFALAFNFICGATYFGANASGGVNLYIFFIVIFILSIVTPKTQFWIWIPFTLICVSVLFALEYWYPEMVKTIYHSPQHRLLDIIQSFFEVTIMVVVMTMFMKKSYNREKELARERLISLEQSNETKDKLFSIVAHDMKAPLASVENYLSLLNQLDMSVGEKTEIEKQLLSSTRHTSEMLQNILSWSKNQMDGIMVELKPIFVLETLKHTIAFQEQIALNKGIRLSISNDQDFKIVADPDMLQLIVRNLLNNAIKFSLPGGKIDLIIKKENNKCLLIIKDEGIGIAADEIPLLFSLKGKNTYGTNLERGVGLGLRLTKTYTELQNGNIWLESELNKGTSFFVNLDLYKET